VPIVSAHFSFLVGNTAWVGVVRVNVRESYSAWTVVEAPVGWPVNLKAAFHKLAFSTAILILFVFLLPISIMFRYLDHLIANRLAPSMCPDPCGTRWGSWFQGILYHISAYLVFVRSAYF